MAFDPDLDVVLERTVDVPSGGTRYHVTVLHGDAKSREAHEAMGFQGSWNAAFDQLVALVPRR